MSPLHALVVGTADVSFRPVVEPTPPLLTPRDTDALIAAPYERSRSVTMVLVIVHSRLPTADITPAKSVGNRPQPPGRGAVRDDPDHTAHPGWNALVALARLLGRRAAQQHLSQGD
jgi:hypothetical protein